MKVVSEGRGRLNVCQSPRFDSDAGYIYKAVDIFLHNFIPLNFRDPIQRDVSQSSCREHWAIDSQWVIGAGRGSGRGETRGGLSLTPASVTRFTSTSRQNLLGLLFLLRLVVIVILALVARSERYLVLPSTFASPSGALPHDPASPRHS